MDTKTRADAIEWVQSLKPGDKVIQVAYEFRDEKPVAILTVKKVTASGIVRTEQDFSFQQFRYTDRFVVRGYGKTRGKIVPYTDELAEQVRAYMQKAKKEKEERAIISTAKSICYELAYGNRTMTLELAKGILKLIRGDD